MASGDTHKPAADGDDRILDCGHCPSPHGPHTTGTAHTPDGREICWTCADTEQRATMRDAAPGVRVMAYLASDGRTITSWSGGELGRVTARVTRRVGFGGATRDYLDVVDLDGGKWSGTSPGPGMYASLRKRVIRAGRRGQS